ncbi:MAG: PD40 domain-containing protein [Saprospiraceae bacterium]|nr:PD40 domain-containing protein [Saprospiraceae bacterium]
MNKQLRLVLALAFFSILSLNNYAQDKLDPIKVQIDKGMYTEALTTLNQHLAKNPNDGKAYGLLADLQLKLGKIDLACATYSMMESMKLCDDQSFYDYGLALKMGGKYDEAIKKFGKVSGKLKEGAQKQIQSCVFAKELIRTEDTKKVMNLDMNSPSSEYGAVLYEQVVVFNGEKSPFMTPQTASLIKDNKGLYLCKTLHNGSSAALFMEGKVNETKMEAFSITQNNGVAFCTTQQVGGSPLERMSDAAIYLGTYNGFGLNNITAFAHNVSGISNYSPCLSEDGLTLYFASNREGGFVGMDLYKSTFDGTNWTAPENLGQDVNGKGNEITPFYASGILWFASESHGGLGGYDIFSSQNTSAGFIDVQHAGYGINSVSNDYFPHVKNLIMYFTSDRMGGKGREDIYRSPISEHTFTVEEMDAPLVSQIETETVEEESEPAAYALNEATLNYGKVENIDALLMGARRVSIGEVLASKDKPRVYFIQLASMIANNSDVNKFKTLVKFGNIYKVKVNNSTKVRLGYFLERSETDVLLQKVRSEGFKDAFIVEQELSTSDLELMLSQMDNKNATGNVSSTPKNNSTVHNNKPKNDAVTGNFEYTKPLPEVTDREYKVRLGSFEDPIWFDSKKVRDLGRLEQWTKGAWTIFILGGYSNYDDADQARVQAINRGYADAEVVIDNGGIIERIKKN